MPITTIDEVAAFVRSPAAARRRRKSSQNILDIHRWKSSEASLCFGFGGTDFAEGYAQVLQVLQQNMTLSPPSRRRHSIAVCELSAYGVQE
mmetsp:Transcript_149753/g.480898  ORF Transcript_149753/g.480898 Transcript_149753/m.480898 type:complete len:91 (+) Transcript_149753:310-582(+)